MITALMAPGIAQEKCLVLFLQLIDIFCYNRSFVHFRLDSKILYFYWSYFPLMQSPMETRGRRDHNRMVLGFTTNCANSAITTKNVSSNPVRDEVYSIQHYVIKFVSDLWQVGGFFRVFQFPTPITLTATI